MQCPACFANATELTALRAGTGYGFRRCTGCGVVFADPMQPGTAEWYEKAADYIPPERPVETLKWYEAVFLAGRAVPPGKNKLLNIGCGKTVFLKKLSEFGYEVHAVDISEQYVRFTREKLGITNVHHADIMDFIRDYRGEKFDCILFFEVLEHLGNPGEFLKRIPALLNDGGSIFLSVPNSGRIGSFEAEWDRPPHHLTRWNKQSLRRVLELNGYAPVTIMAAPMSAEDLMYKLGIYFGTERLRAYIRSHNSGASVRMLYAVLFFVRVGFYNAAARLMRIFLKEKGLNIYAQARLGK
ncbi:MAG: class I SAM-dependent methyltransferase [Candidatus Omnitrophica bacterium]|nr:class I SAM-dependent methyltransferase [Candidatus Omnitrophota bacterium]